MYCVKCGKKINDTDKFCSDCGTKAENSNVNTVVSDAADPNDSKNINEKNVRGNVRILMKILIIAALVCFFMPFVTVSCASMDEEVTGIDLVTGNEEYDYYLYDEETGEQDSIVNIFVVISAIGGVIALFTKVKLSGRLSFISSFMLIVFRLTAKGYYQVNEEILTVKFNGALYAAILLFASAYAVSRYIQSNGNEVINNPEKCVENAADSSQKPG